MDLKMLTCVKKCKGQEPNHPPGIIPFYEWKLTQLPYTLKQASLSKLGTPPVPLWNVGGSPYYKVNRVHVAWPTL